jgi:DNA topoisomerase-3
MSKSLILSEKPSQAQDIARGLDDRFNRKDGCIEGSRYIVTWAFGHLVLLEDAESYDKKYKKWNPDDLPIIPTGFKYCITKDGAKQFKTIKTLINNSDIDRVVIATDPGREGELIARLILTMSGNKKPLYRFWTSKALTPDAVKEGFKNLKKGEEFDRLYQAALARQQADWLVGINSTRAFTVKLGELYSLGRVQTPTLAIIVNRELEIKNFKPQDYWLFWAEFKHKDGEYEGLWFSSKYRSPESQPPAHQSDEETSEGESLSRILKEEHVKEIQARVDGKAGIIESCETKTKEESPPLLFSLTVLQQAANRAFGFSADKTLQLAQSLYEGKYITYPRTESQHLNEEMSNEASKILKELTQYKQVSFDINNCKVSEKNKRIFDSSKLTDHHALIPTGKIPSDLKPDEEKLYELIVRRFISAFYPDFKYKTTTVITVVGQDRFKTTGKTVISQGWKEVYGVEENEQSLPPLKEKDAIHVIKTDIEKKQTTPPPRYTDASILQAMTNAHRFIKDEELKKKLKETAGLGTAATRAAILETLKNRGYIERKGKSLIPTEKGIFLISKVKNERISDPAYTALWEQELDAIASGEIKTSDSFMTGIKVYTKDIVEKAKVIEACPIGSQDGRGGIMGNKNGIKEQREAIGKCPECGNPVYENAKAFGCSRWKEGCKFTLWKNLLEKLGKKTISAKQAKILLEGGNIKLTGLKGKSGKEFDAEGKLTKDEKYGWGVGLVFSKEAVK